MQSANIEPLTGGNAFELAEKMCNYFSFGSDAEARTDIGIQTYAYPHIHTEHRHTYTEVDIHAYIHTEHRHHINQ